MTQSSRTRRRKKQIIPVEVVPEVIETPAPIKTFSVIQVTQPEMEIPESPNPYFLASKEGLFLHRNLLIGRGYVPQKKWPEDQLKSIGKAKNGKFWWKAPVIPAEVCAAIVAWFKHIYEMQHTEAEVILLLNHKTLEWKIWIPTQQVSHTGVKSAYEPADIPNDYVVVGSMHSHCDFGAFHSSTDTSDANTFDGVHLTIGHIMDEKPQVAAMVMMNKVQFDYEDVDMIADFSDLTAGEFNPAWDEYVETTEKDSRRAKNYELFEKYQPPTRAITKWTPPVSTWKSNQVPYNPPTTRHYTGSEDWDMWDDYFNYKYRPQEEPNTLWENKKKDENTTTQIIRKFDADYWEDALPDNLVDVIMDSSTLQEKDIDHVMANFQDGMSTIWWRVLYMQKMSDCATVLNALGMDVRYSIKVKKFTREEGK